jgi:hypothetical protein
LDLVPSDFVIQGISYLSQLAETRNQVFQLADPRPLKVMHLLAEFEKVLGKKIHSVSLPLSMARFALKTIPGLERWMGVPHSALNYFVHPTHYDTSNTSKFLQGTTIQIPQFDQYLPILVEYMKKNRHLRTKALT